MTVGLKKCNKTQLKMKRLHGKIISYSLKEAPTLFLQTDSYYDLLLFDFVSDESGTESTS